MKRKILTVPFEQKETDSALGIVRGYGSVFNVKDSHGDVVEPGAFLSSLKNGGRNRKNIPMLWNHDAKRPIGVWTQLVEDAKGLKVEGRLLMSIQDGREAFSLIQEGAMSGLSIGYDVLQDRYDQKTKTRYLTEVELWEISPVVFGANREAHVEAVKSIPFDEEENPYPFKMIIPCSDGKGFRYEYCKTILGKMTSPDQYKELAFAFAELETLQNQIASDYDDLKIKLGQIQKTVENFDEPDFSKLLDLADSVASRLRKTEDAIKQAHIPAMDEVEQRLANLHKIFINQSSKTENKKGEYVPEQKKPSTMNFYERFGYYSGNEQAEQILMNR